MPPTHIDWTRWCDQQVRDLAWCCLTPPLMSSLPATDATPWQVEASPALLQWLDQLAADPEPLKRHLAAVKSTRLGLYFEQLWIFLWQQDPAMELLSHNQQITRQGKTLGAFDFLLQDQSAGQSRYWHLEAALKFYLGSHPTSRQWQDWTGPNTEDTLAHKLNRLRTHQLRLSQLPEWQNWQPASGIPLSAFARRTLLAGRFYAPWQTPQLLPDGGNPLLDKALWCHRQDLDKVLQKVVQSGRGKILSRQQWLAPALNEGDLESFDTLAGQLPNALSHALQLAFFQPAKESNTMPMIETLRLFVLPDHWPNTATPERNT